MCISKSNSSLCVLFSRTGAGVGVVKFLVHFPVDHLPTQSCLHLYLFCANLLHSLTMWLIVSSLSLHSLHLLFC